MFYPMVLSFISFVSVIAMEPNGPLMEIDLTLTGAEIRQIARLVLASSRIKCIKGNCVCSDQPEMCKNLIAHNNYLEKKAQEAQDQAPSWRQGQRKSF